VGDYVIYSGTIWQRSSGAVGTVTSVAATITGDSVTISGSPVTTSGTLAFTFNGTTAQYIRGNGTLATFPSLTGFVPYTGATTNVNLGTHSLSAYDLIINHTSGSGVAAQITKGGNGEALTVVKSSGSGNAASITGGVTLLDELHLNTDLADAYIASATNWNAAYNDKINSAAVTGTTTKTLTLTQQDGGTITASWTDDNTDAVTSVFGRTGAVVAVSGDYTTSLVTEGTNLYFTNARARAAISAGTGISYNSSTGVITNTITQYTDALARAAISLTTTGTSGAATYNNTTGVLNIPQYADQFVGTVTSVGLSAPTGFSVSGSPVTSSGTLALSFASGYSLPTTAKQTTWDTAYDRSLTAASVSGTTTKTLTLTKQDGSTLTASWTDDNTDAVTSVFGRTGAVVATSGDYTTAQVTESGNLYFTNARAIASTLTGYTSGAGTITSSDSILSAIQKLNGNIGALTTGVSSVNGLTGAVTLTTSNIAEGTNLYYTEARVSANTNVAANTAARHNAVTLGTANGLSLSTQVLSLGLASTSTTGALSSTDWNTFNNKTSNTGTVTSVGLSSATSGVTIGSTPITTSGTITLAIATASGSAQGLLSSTDWTTFNNKQNALTNPVTGTGTTNYLPKFTGASTIGNSQIFDDGTNVGIGTATPSRKLDVSGSGRFTGDLTIANSSRLFLNGSTGQDWALRTNSSTANFEIVDWDSTVARIIMTPSGNLGLGVTPSAWAVTALQGPSSFSIANQGNNGLNLLSNAYYGSNWTYITTAPSSWYQQINSEHRFYTAPSGTAGNAISFTQAMTLDASGRLGIGTTSPNTIFSVVKAETVNAFTDFAQFSDNTNGLRISNYFDAGGIRWDFRRGTTSVISISQANNVGIGTTSPANKLTVAGSSGTIMSLSNGADADLLMNFTSGVTLLTPTTSILAFGTGSSEKMRISGSNVGIGTTSPSTTLDISVAEASLRLTSTTGTNFTNQRIVNTGGTLWSGIERSTGGVLGITGAYEAFLLYGADNPMYIGTGNSFLRFGTNSAERMRITNVGRVGIGTTAPNEKLDVNGAIQFRSDSVGYGTTTSVGMIDFYDAGARFLSFGANSSTKGAFSWYQAGQNNNNGSVAMTITTAGNVEINTGSIKTGEPDTGYGRAAVKIGARNTGQAFDSGGHLPVNIDGTIYYINLYSSLP
jgi:hypothetical protein